MRDKLGDGSFILLIMQSCHTTICVFMRCCCSVFLSPCFLVSMQQPENAKASKHNLGVNFIN
jgi:hypothetical protein